MKNIGTAERIALEWRGCCGKTGSKPGLCRLPGTVRGLKKTPRSSLRRAQKLNRSAVLNGCLAGALEKAPLCQILC